MIENKKKGQTTRKAVARNMKIGSKKEGSKRIKAEKEENNQKKEHNIRKKQIERERQRRQR